MNNPEVILRELDSHLSQKTELILYGRGALAIAFPEIPNCPATLDVDVIIPSEEEVRFDENLQFWEALEKTNDQLGASGLYLTHLFLDQQIILSPDWRSKCVAILKPVFKHLVLFRPSSEDLILSKMMRVDPQDREDIRQILQINPKPVEDWAVFFNSAQVPDSPELREAFQQNQAWFFSEGLHEITR